MKNEEKASSEFGGEEAEKEARAETNYTGLIGLLVLGVVLGVFLKVVSANYITMGFDDYRLVENQSDFDLSPEEPAEEEGEELEDDGEENAGEVIIPEQQEGAQENQGQE